MSPDQRIARRAERTHGVFTREAAVACGFTPDGVQHRLKTGRWVRVHRGVYRVNGAPATSRQRIMAAVLAGGRGSRASHRSAGELFDLDRVPTGHVEIVVPKGRRVRIPGVTVHHATIEQRDRATVDGIPVTTPSRTIIDLAAVVERDDLEDALDDAIRRRLVDPRALQARLERMSRRGRPGSGALLLLVATRTRRNVPGSRWESVVRRAIVRGGLPEPVRQFEVHDGAGRFVARPDLAYPHARVYIEYDGRGHADPRRRARDLARQNRLSELGWRPLVFHDADLHGAASAIARKVRNALRASNGGP